MTSSTAEMKDVSTSDTGRKRLLQIGGLAGIVGGAFLFVPLLFAGNSPGGGFVSVPALDPGGWPHFLATFSQNNAPLGEMVGLSVLGFTAIPVFVALCRTVKGYAQGYALLGAVLGVVAATCLVIFVMLRYEAFSSAASLYNSAAAGDQATILLIAKNVVLATYGLFLAQGVFWILAVLVTGAAIFGSPAFGKGYGVVGMIFALLLAGSLAAAWSAGPDASNIGYALIALLYSAWMIIQGQKLLRLSRSV